MSIIIILTYAHIYKWSHWICTASEKGYSTSQRASLCDISASALSRIAFNVCIRETLLSTFTSQSNIRSLYVRITVHFFLYVGRSSGIQRNPWTILKLWRYHNEKEKGYVEKAVHSFCFFVPSSIQPMMSSGKSLRSCSFLINGIFSQIDNIISI